MKEEFLHFIFKNQLWNNKSLYLTDGRSFEIIDTGILNHDSGPDFFNAKIKLDNTIWAGNIEIHINASDWNKHNHQHDDAYNNVILHVVYKNDKPIMTKNDEIIPTWEIDFPHFLYNRYSSFNNSLSSIACSDYLDIIDDFLINLWIERMGIEKLETKKDLIDKYLNITNSDWEQTFYIILSRNFGFHKNSQAFEQLALSTNLNIIRKIADKLFSIEALLFGQAGLLEDITHDNYSLSLLKEYEFLANKYNLTPIDKKLWKTGRLRPGNMPTIRIAQLAALLQNFQGLFAAIVNEEKITEISKFFRIKGSEYWDTHYQFGKPCSKTSNNLGKTAFEIIMINTIAAFNLIYSRYFNRENTNIAIEWLQELKPEENRIIKEWKSCGIMAKSSFESQALIHLKNNYCDLKKCINCNIGVSIFKKMYKQA